MKSGITALILTLLLSGPGRVFAQTVLANASVVTPALLLSFSGKVQDNTAQLDWMMENQTNCKWFIIERAGQTGGYDSINVVAGINNGNQTEYDFTDSHMLNGNNCYRLRQVDRDGTVRYSRIVTLYKEDHSARLSVFPNPAAAVLNFSIFSPAAEQVSVQVYNLSGVVLMSIRQQLCAGSNQQSLAIAGLKNGNYFLKISNHSGSSQYVQSFVKIL